jgi:EAL domain-containing protein (putative c-di-GMP-specific phosphodiesterase class I)
MTLEALARLELEPDLRRVLETGAGLVLHYQPIFDVQTQRLVSCEALVRWVHPHGGLIGPDVFLPLAEETGLVVPLGEWVLNEACRQLKEWHALSGLAELSVSVNLSPRHFRDAGLVAQVVALLDQYDLEPSHLVLEVTEGVLVDEQARETLSRLDDLGLGVSIDDFGTGYSSLNYLGALDADGLKIDRRFVSGLTEKGREAAIVRAIIALGDSLGMTVTAEGVETAEQLQTLRRLGCHRMQGFLIGKPASAADFATHFLGTSPAAEPTVSVSVVAFGVESPRPTRVAV